MFKNYKFSYYDPGLLLILAVFVYLKIPGLEPKIADENIYFYMATLVPKGLLPYKDFFYANPPGLLIFLSIAGIVSGKSFLGFKLVPLVAGAGSVALTYFIVQSRFSKFLAFLSAILLAFTYDWLRVTTHATGGNVTIFLMLFTVLLVIYQKPVLAGLVFGLAFITKVYAVTAFPAIIFLVFMLSSAFTQGGSGDDKNRLTPEGKRDDNNKLTPFYKVGKGDAFIYLLKFILSFTILVSTVLGICWLIGGNDFWRQSVLYHMQKPEAPSHNMKIFLRVLRTNQPLTEFLGISILLLPILWFTNKKSVPWNKDQISILAFSGIWIITLAVFLSIQKKIFDQYFILGFPAAVIFIGSVFSVVINKIESIRIYKKVVMFWVILLLLFSLVWGAKRFRQHEERSLNITYNTAEYIKNNSNPTDTIFGDSVTAPLLALLSGREIAAYEADTNAMRFRSEISDPEYVLDRALGDNVKFMVLRVSAGKYKDKKTGETKWGYYPAGLFRVDVFGEHLFENWKLDTQWIDPTMKEYKIELYVRK